MWNYDVKITEVWLNEGRDGFQIFLELRCSYREVVRRGSMAVLKREQVLEQSSSE